MDIVQGLSFIYKRMVEIKPEFKPSPSIQYRKLFFIFYKQNIFIIHTYYELNENRSNAKYII